MNTQSVKLEQAVEAAGAALWEWLTEGSGSPTPSSYILIAARVAVEAAVPILQCGPTAE